MSCYNSHQISSPGKCPVRWYPAGKQINVVYTGCDKQPTSIGDSNGDLGGLIVIPLVVILLLNDKMHIQKMVLVIVE